MPKNTPNPTASEMAHRRWAKTTKAERSEFGRFVASHGAGRPRSKDRCACGKMTRARAADRKHVCQ